MYIHLICYSLHSLQIIGAQGQDYSRQSDSEEVASLRSDVHPSLEQDLTPPLKTRLKVTSDFTLSLPRPHSYTQMRLRICACRRVIGKSNVGCQLDIARRGDW